MKRPKPSEADMAAALAGLRKFNDAGMAAIANLTAQAADLEARIAGLEDFQKTLVAPGDRSKASGGRKPMRAFSFLIRQCSLGEAACALLSAESNVSVWTRQ